jgi:hypothetical protein
MSSTRRASDGKFHQERYCSAPEFEGDTISGLAAAKRIAIVKDPATRQLLWWIQWLSLTPGALQALCDELVATFHDRIGTPTFRKLERRAEDRELTQREIETLEGESHEYFPSVLGDFFSREELLDEDERGHSVIETRKLRAHWFSEAADVVAERVGSLKEQLVSFCLDPQQDIARGVWFFDDLASALTSIRERRIKQARARLADTAITRKINETLDFSYARRRMVLIEGVAGIGRSESAKIWCEAHPGMVRYVEVPSSGDDRSFYSAVARALGIARGFAYNPQQIKLRVEDMLVASELMLVLDESQFLWPQVQRPRGVPPRMLWTKTLFDAGSPIALIALDDFSRWQELYVKKTLWTDQQFERRLNRRVALPPEHSQEDMLKIARAHFPAGDSRTWKLLAAYALGTEKKQASGIVEALESARYRAESAGREEPLFADIEAALIHDHRFLSGRPSRDEETTSRPAATRLHGGCKAGATPRRRTAGESELPIRIPQSGAWITAPTFAV